MEIARHTHNYLVRHGEFVGMDGPALPARHLPLTATGGRQARRVAEFLALRRPSCLYTSPVRRARETAEIIGERLGFAPVVRHDLRGDRPPGDEELTRTTARAERELDRIATVHKGERVVCVTHADLIAAAVLRYSGRPDVSLGEVEVGFCSVWTLSVVGRFVTLRYLDHAEIAARLEPAA